MNAAVSFNSDKSVQVPAVNNLRARVLQLSQRLDVQTNADLHAQHRIANKIAQESLAAAIKLQQKQAAEAHKIEQAIAQAKKAIARVNQLSASKLKGAIASRAMGDINKLHSTSAGKSQARSDLAQQYQNVGKFWDLQ